MWMRAGECEVGDSGPKPLSWQELESWARVEGQMLIPWEAKMIREMSAAYVSESYRAREKNRMAPFKPLESMRAGGDSIRKAIRGA